ncbi:hypothetical protein [Clostridium algidicarnis]|uniref:hypothetical protein n=1 Tax=Clostridium algidicarnis TaxID=37659 RepID=UPI001C0AF381|nr:hypothetical protein [Clostridium algidicarnis]MBU3202765.1 hypothetical protein [Clostridium algidicarnis]MBU3210919.1 hypothetical protein [Clostridium algidicarnis]MBU3222573.1 hypothetical protein [Clostridium algidicarnis]
MRNRTSDRCSKIYYVDLWSTTVAFFKPIPLFIFAALNKSTISFGDLLQTLEGKDKLCNITNDDLHTIGKFFLNDVIMQWKPKVYCRLCIDENFILIMNPG